MYFGGVEIHFRPARMRPIATLVLLGLSVCVTQNIAEPCKNDRGAIWHIGSGGSSNYVSDGLQLLRGRGIFVLRNESSHSKV